MFSRFVSENKVGSLAASKAAQSGDCSLSAWKDLSDDSLMLRERGGSLLVFLVLCNLSLFFSKSILRLNLNLLTWRIRSKKPLFSWQLRQLVAEDYKITFSIPYFPACRTCQQCSHYCGESGVRYRASSLWRDVPTQ